MTFISAFRCQAGIVLGADSQETVGDYKLHVDKLEPIPVGKYQLAIGGAGLGPLVDDLCEQMQEWVEEWDTTSEKEIKALLRPKLREFYQVDAAAYPEDAPENKVIQAILCLKHRNKPDPMLFIVNATTVKIAPKFAFVGWDIPVLNHFARRLYRSNMPISQGVLLTLYLFSIVGSTATAVGGDTRILIARDNGIHVHNKLYVAKIQENIGLFTSLIDRLVLSCPDTSLQEKQFEIVLSEFIETSRHIRKQYLHAMGHLAIINALQNPQYTGEAYEVIPLGSTIEIPGGEVREQTSAEIEENRRMFEAAKQDYNKATLAQFRALISGRQALFLGKEKVHVRGTAGPVADSDAS